VGIRKIVHLAVAFAILASISACATSFDKRGRYYKVRGGESIWSIAKAYRVDVQDLAELNGIFSPSDVKPGTKLYIPEREKKAGFKKLPFNGVIDKAEAKEGKARRGPGGKRRGGDEYTRPIETYHGKFMWPVDGPITSSFGIRDGRRHDGIDISAREGTPIKAAAEGRVVYAGTMRGYGNLILVRHDDNFFTAYAHNHANKVKKEQHVKRGQQIGEAGRTGRATGSHLHFEIRDGQKARNPLFFLPERKR
jgi:lipoprotein NlpD